MNKNKREYLYLILSLSCSVNTVLIGWEGCLDSMSHRVSCLHLLATKCLPLGWNAIEPIGRWTTECITWEQTKIILKLRVISINVARLTLTSLKRCQIWLITSWVVGCWRKGHSWCILVPIMDCRFQRKTWPAKHPLARMYRFLGWNCRLIGDLTWPRNVWVRPNGS